MSKTFSDIVFDTRVFLDEAEPEDFTVAEVAAAVNWSYQHVVSKVIEVYQEFYLTVTPRTYSTVANQGQYSIATTFLKIERVEINYQPADPNSQPQRAMALKMDELPLALSNNLVGGSALFNSGYYLIGNQGVQVLGFVPVPENAGTDNISVWGIEAPADMVNSSDPVIIPYPDLFAGIIGKLAAGRLLKKGQQAVGPADDLIGEANTDILNMQTYISERQSDGPNMIIQSEWDDINTGAVAGVV